MDVQVEDLDANNDAPEIAGKQADIEEGGRGNSEHEGGKGVKEGDADGVADYVTTYFTVPDGSAEGAAVKDASLRAVDQHAPKA